MRINWAGFGLLIAITAAFSSCGPNYIYQKKHEFEADQWSYADTINFVVDIPDTLSIYNLYLEVKHSTDFSYQNLYANIYTQFPGGERLKELASLELSNNGGLWMGKCTSKYCTLNIPIQKGAYFNVPGKYTFTLEQFMRVNPIQGIKSFAFRVEDTGEERNF